MLVVIVNILFIKKKNHYGCLIESIATMEVGNAFSDFLQMRLHVQTELSCGIDAQFGFVFVL